jgi:fructokinase
VSAPRSAAVGGDSRALYGAIEAGGTKFICAVGTGEGALLEQVRIDTRDPGSTLAAVFQYFRAAEARVGAVTAFGVGAFGPVELRRNSPRYGHITTTPKPGWQDTDLLGILARTLERPVGFDTDVNAAALGELRWGACRGLSSLVYVTVGTGIGGGVVQGGAPVHGLMHPEVGHIRVQRHPADRDFAGVCPYHGDCLEGLASGPAIRARSGASLEALDEGDAAWELESDYLGQLAAALALMHSPQRIVLGGGVMLQERLFPRIRARMLAWLNGYLPSPELSASDYLVPPGLGESAGIRGALALALECPRSLTGAALP